MGLVKTFVDLVVFAVCVAVAVAIVFSGISALEGTVWMASSRDHAALGVIGMVFAMAIMNCMILLGIGICRKRALDRREDSPRVHG